MKLIVGLGNPGVKYSVTRHNAGRALIETVADNQGLTLTHKKALRASVASDDVGGNPVTWAFPESYMNDSGQPVKQLVDYFGIDPGRDLLLVVDEAALPFGKLRLRGHGSDGGHKGLRSVEAFLERRDYARLRIGVGPAANEGENGPAVWDGPLEDYVLGRFTKEEQRLLADVLERAQQGCYLWLSEPIGKVMQVVNS